MAVMENDHAVLPDLDQLASVRDRIAQAIERLILARVLDDREWLALGQMRSAEQRELEVLVFRWRRLHRGGCEVEHVTPNDRVVVRTRTRPGRMPRGTNGFRLSRNRAARQPQCDDVAYRTCRQVRDQRDQQNVETDHVAFRNVEPHLERSLRLV